MTIPVSTVDAAKDYLFTQISALSIVTAPPVSGLDPILVVYDEPGKYQPPEMIMVGFNVHQTADIHSFMGSGARYWLNEKYRIEVKIQVFRGGDDASGTWKRANSISQAVDTMIRTDPSCGGLVNVAYPASYVSSSGWDAAGKGRIVEILKEIEFEVLN